MRVGDDVGSGMAKVTLSFDEWKGRGVRPAVVEVLVNPPKK